MNGTYLRQICYLFLLCFILIPTSTLASSALERFLLPKLSRNDTVWHPSEWNTTLQHLISGPLQSRPLVIYYDDTVSIEQKEFISTILSSLPTSLTIVDCQAKGDDTSETLDLLSDPGWVSVIFFHNELVSSLFDDTTKGFQINYLLLINLASQNLREKEPVDILKKKVFSSIRSVALIIQQIGREKEPIFSLNSYQPFATDDQTRFTQKLLSSRLESIDDVFQERFPSFNSYRFQIASSSSDVPFLYPSSISDPNSIAGTNIVMLETLGKTLNFTYSIIINLDDKWGSYGNGSWNGMLGMIERDECNFTANNFGYGELRVRDFDFTVPYWVDSFGIALLVPPPVAKWINTWRPFDVAVWAAVLSTLVLCTVLVIVQNSVLPVSMDRLPRHNSGVWLQLLRSLFDNGWHSLPRVTHQVVFAGSWFLFCFILTSSYKATLITFLTVPLQSARVQTLDQLKDSNFRLVMEDYDSTAQLYIASSEIPTLKALNQKMDLVATTDNLVELLADNQHAAIEAYYFLYYTLIGSSKVQNFYMLEEKFIPNYLCWYFKKGTAFLHRFSDGIQRLIEAGLVDYWMRVVKAELQGPGSQILLQNPSSNKASNKVSKGNESLTLEHLQGAFLILIFVNVVAFAVFLSELIWAKLTKVSGM